MPRVLYHTNDEARAVVTPLETTRHWILGEAKDPRSPYEWIGLFCRECMYNVLVDGDRNLPEHNKNCSRYDWKTSVVLFNKWKVLHPPGYTV